MREAEQISTLLGDIYDAALDPALWSGVVEKSMLLIGGFSATLVIRSVNDRTANISNFGCAPDEHYDRLYSDELGKFDPRDWSAVKVGEVTSNATFMPHAEFRETRFHREWMQPQGVGDNLICVLDRSPASHAAFGLFRHESEGPTDKLAFRRMRLIMPHMRRAVLIGNAIAQNKAEAATFADALDQLSAGVFLVDADRRIVHANAPGRDLLARGSLLRAVAGKLAVNEPGARRMLDEGVAMAAEGERVAGGNGIAVPLQACDTDRYIAHLLPLTSGVRRRAGTMYQAVAALFVHKAALNVATPAAIVARTFNLTPSELRVLLAIVGVGGVPETAATLGIAENTVKTHLRRLYAKTSTGRQAELVKLVAGFSSPLVG